MILVDNLKILKEKKSMLYHYFKQAEDIIHENYSIEHARNKMETLLINQNGKAIYLHSKYDPLKEAEEFVSKIGDLKEYKHILFVGTGLGYHIKLILEQYPKLKFSIFEPNQSVLDAFLKKQNLKKYKKDRLIEIFSDISQIVDKPEFLKYYSGNTIDIILPVIRQMHQQEIDIFYKELSDVIKSKKDYMHVNALLQKRWMINPIINFSKLVKTPNLLLDLDKEAFKDKPVVIVSAGPSLAEDLKYIQQIKDEGRAYVFAVGSAINALIAHNIMPDGFFSVDPNHGNIWVAKNVIENKLDIPLIFGSTIGFEVLNEYPGKLISFMINKDNFSKYLLDYDDEIVVFDAVTVANMTLQPLLKLGMTPIIFAGQNLAYLDNKRYSSGIEYTHITNEITQKEEAAQKYVLSVNGEEIATSEEYIKMKKDMEGIIRTYPHREYINTTKNGAHIEGTNFMTIDKVINKKLLDKNIVKKNWTEGKPSYNLEFAKEKFNKLEKSFDELLKLVNKCLEYLSEIKKMNTSGNYSKLEIYLSAYDKLFEIVQENIFFRVIIQPMTMVQHEVFIDKSGEVARAGSSRLKVNLFNDIFGYYMDIIYAAIVYVQPAFYELKKGNVFNG